MLTRCPACGTQLFKGGCDEWEGQEHDRARCDAASGRAALVEALLFAMECLQAIPPQRFGDDAGAELLYQRATGAMSAALAREKERT